jgi:hypothetical protein
MRETATQASSAGRQEAAEVAILSRLFLNGDRGVRRDFARHILELGFTEEDKARMHELAIKNQEGEITGDELRELDDYVRAGDLLAILKLRARRLLKAKPK